MEFKFSGFDVQRHYTPRASSPSSSTYAYISGQPTYGGVGTFREYQLMEIHREIEKERIREEIIAAEIERQMVLEAEVRREFMRTHYHHNPYNPPMLHGEWFTPDDTIRATPYPEKYVRGGSHGYEIGGFEAVPFRGRLPSPNIKEGKTGIIGLGRPSGVMSGSKRKAGLPPSPPTVLGSTGASSNTSKKKIKEEWNCIVCGISLTSKHDLNKHLSGKKHQAQMEAPKACNNNDAALCKPVPIDLKEDKKVTGEGTSKKFRFWCSMCQVGAQDEKIMSSHKNGKKHMANLLKKARGKTKPSGRKSI